MPRPGLPLVHFNDTRCGSIAELRSVILRARVSPMMMWSESGQPRRSRPGCSPRSRKTSRVDDGYRGNGAAQAVCSRTPRRLADKIQRLVPALRAASDPASAVLRVGSHRFVWAIPGHQCRPLGPQCER
jgi:hypothetical protein